MITPIAVTRFNAFVPRGARIDPDAPATVYIVDDDADAREEFQALIEAHHYIVHTLSSGEEFLAAYDPGRPACIVLDVRLPGMSGLELIERLRERDALVPVIIITGFADVSDAVRAMKAGAVDFLEKPCRGELLLERLRVALTAHAQALRDARVRAELAERLARLTPRERQVMDLVVNGKANKVIAAELSLSEKTVEVHRSRVMQKLEADSLATLVRTAILLGAIPTRPAS